LAEIAAMEFLMPYSRRAGMIEAIAKGVNTLAVFSDLYKLPEEIIDLYLSPSYMLHLGKAQDYKPQ
jgi:hypothetical protein